VAQDAAGERHYAAVESFVRTITEALVTALGWVVLAVPFAAFCLVAQSVGRSGLGVFADLWLFLAAIMGAMALHALGWYALFIRIAAGRSPRDFYRAAADAVVTGVGTNSSLATVPVTLRALDRLGVSPESARLAALAGTNLNNDGISLYEVMAALMIAQACGLDLGIGGQALLAVAALTAAAGIAGIPEAGLVVLPLVLDAAGLPESVIAVAVPLVVPVDWILARCRTVVNVLADMTVATVLDRG
jgi:Na+/H+-dicarboxylate symporter